MALGDDDGTIDPDELVNFIDVVTNPDNENFNLEASKTIFKDKLYNSIENKNTKYLAALKKEKDDEQAEKDKDDYTSVTTRKTVGGKVQLQVPGGEQGELLEASSAKVRQIEDAVKKSEPNVGITGHFGFYYPKAKGRGFVRYDSIEQFIELNGGGASTVSYTHLTLPTKRIV